MDCTLAELDLVGILTYSPARRNAAPTTTASTRMPCSNRPSRSGFALVMTPLRLASTIRETVPRTRTPRPAAQLRAARSSRIASASGNFRQSVRTWLSPKPKSHAATKGSTRSTGVTAPAPSPSIQPRAASASGPARSSTATPSGTITRELSRKIKSSRPIFPRSIKGEAFMTQTSLTFHLGLDFIRF